MVMNLQIGPQPEEERTQDFESNGIKYKLKAEDPHGWVRITCLKTNKRLEGMFTSFTEARKAAVQDSIKLSEQKVK